MPSPLMKQLLVDHGNFIEFLDILEGQVDRLEAGERTDLEIVEVILSYHKRYSDQCHHPREDLIYEVLREKDSLLTQSCAWLADEHSSLQQATARALDAVRDVLDGDTLDAIMMSRMLTGYIGAYRSHIESENQSLFPIAHQHLTTEDWREVELEAALLSGVERALHVQKRFLALRDYIHRLDRLNPR